ncbi:MAG: NUDIX domain-containing protein, partial [Gammaproteobacteria bacterium]|nr:NUDIX domain-containing protein [Gammaproteobacteria bacterium]
QLIKAKLVPYRHGELYPVTTGGRDQALFLMDRALVTHFGVSAFGQHMNGFVRRNGEIHMWISRRSQQKRHAPGMLDNLVAGGLPWGLKFEENLAKECWEEAGIPAELAGKAQHVGAITYCRQIEAGVKPDTMYCYDLELPEEFIPRCTDGEVESFELLPLERVAKIVHDSSDFKLNCNLVIIDFLIRHEYITAEHSEYGDLIQGLS